MIMADSSKRNTLGKIKIDLVPSVKPSAALKRKAGEASGGRKPPIKTTGIQFGIKPPMKGTRSSTSDDAGLKLTIASKNSTSMKPISVMKPKSRAVAAAFNDEDGESEEEMPPEAKMRMRNLGRDTKTAEGPKSYGKTSHGFLDRSAILRKEFCGEGDKGVVDKCAPHLNGL